MRKLYTLPLSILGILFFFSTGSVFGQNQAPTAVDDVYHIFVNYSVYDSVSTNDFDIDYNLDKNSYQIVTPAKIGTLYLAKNGVISYYPKYNYNGSDTMTYKVCDIGGLCDTAFIIISTDKVNNPPIAQNGTFTTNLNTPLSNSLRKLVSDFDKNLDTASYSLVNLPAYGTMTMNWFGNFTYTPTSGFVGIDSVQYKVCDLGSPALCDTGTIIINIVSSNPTLSITAQPLDIEECMGGDVALQVGIAGGTGVVTYEWQQSNDGVNFTTMVGETMPSFVPFATFPGTTFYRCVIKSGTETVTSNSAMVTVNPSISFISQPVNIKLLYKSGTIAADSNAVFKAAVMGGSGMMSYQWQCSSNNSTWSNLTENTTNVGTKTTTLTLVKPKISEVPYFHLVASSTGSGCQSATSATGILTFQQSTVVTPLSITAQPQNVEECMGGSAVLQVGIAGGTGIVTYAWQQSNDGVNFTTMVGETMPSFVPFATFPGTTFYRCIIKSGTETVTSNSAMVNVNPSISFISQPVNIKLLYKSGTIAADSNAVFKAAIMGGSGMMSYQWQCSSNNSTWSNLTENTTNVGTKTTTLTLVKPKISEVPYFHLVASSTGSGCQAATSATGILTFQQSTIVTALSITAQPLNIEECMGGNVALQVGVAGGTGVISYQWQQSSDNVNFTSIAGSTTPNFMPTSTMPGVSYYRCVIKAGTETVTSNSATVTVNPSISFISQPVNVKLLYKSGTIAADSNAVFKAAVMGGSGMMSYQWQCSSNNSTWSNLTENTTNVGTKTTTLTLVKPKISEVPYFHLVASSTGSGCQSATSATGILTFEVKPIANVAPDAVNDNFTTIQAVAINATVAANDTDAEGALNLTSFKVIKNPKNGNLTMFNNGSFTYIPATPFIGVDTASYSVCDVPGLCDTALIFFKVIKGNHLPTITKDAFATKMNTALKGSVALNDTDFDNNLNKSSYKTITNPKNGNVKMWANGDILYLPKQNFIGKDTFYYQACDSLGLCGNTEVIVTIRGGFITGKIYYDANNNGVFDSGDLGVPNELVTFDTDGKTFTSSIGDFQIAADTSKSYVITPTLNNPLWTVNPLSKTVKTSNNFDQLIENQYFTLRPASQVSDLAINVEAGNARPGFSSVTTLTYYNKGTTVLNGKVTLTLDNNVVYESSDVALTQRSGNSLTWSVVNLQPFESRNLMIFTKTNVNAPLNGNVVYAYEGTLTSATDADATNSKGTATIAIRGSYDPNDITVDRREYIRKATDATTPNVPLAYTIRFQNTGNAEAIRVEVLDTIQEKLDLTAFEMIAASHKFEVQIVPDTNKVKRNYTVVKWIFDNINLLDSTSKEACSHGFVKYSIKNISTKTNYVKDSILNKAAIYFDFNSPVITNTATTKFSTLTVSSLEQYNLEFKAYPNPTNGIVNIDLAHEADATIEIFNAVGQAVSRQILRGSNGQVDMSGFQTGFYIVTIKTQKGSGSVKILKE
jgi:hypothetical protein